MSLAIDVDTVCSVLLADGWHSVADESFSIDAYEFVWNTAAVDGGELAHGGGDSDVCASGFSFYEDLDENAGDAYVGNKVRVCGPLTAILAVREAA